MNGRRVTLTLPISDVLYLMSVLEDDAHRLGEDLRKDGYYGEDEHCTKWCIGQDNRLAGWLRRAMQGKPVDRKGARA